MSRLRAGEWVAGLGAAGLLVLLFLDWFGRADGAGASAALTHTSGWGALGWFMDVLLCVLIAGAALLAFMTARRTSPAWPVGAAVLTWTVGTLIVVALLVRVTVAQPGRDELVSVQLPAYLGLVLAALIPAGAFVSVRDERTETPEARAYTPPPARTAPGT